MGDELKLAEWMDRAGLDDAALAAQLGVSRSSVSRLRRGRSLLSRKVAAGVFRLSGGLVTPNDFYGLGEGGGGEGDPGPGPGDPGPAPKDPGAAGDAYKWGDLIRGAGALHRRAGSLYDGARPVRFPSAAQQVGCY